MLNVQQISVFLFLHFLGYMLIYQIFLGTQVEKIIILPSIQNMCTIYSNTIRFDIYQKILFCFVLGTKCFIRAWKRIVSQILFYINWWVMKCVFVKSWLLMKVFAKTIVKRFSRLIKDSHRHMTNGMAQECWNGKSHFSLKVKYPRGRLL